MSTTDTEIRAMLEDERLSTALLGDICDLHGRYHQFLPPEIKGIAPATILVGRAMPVLTQDVFAPQPRPFGALTDALDQLESGEVYVGGGGLLRNASWGELLTITAKGRGAVGAILDGFHRDTRAVLREDWPVFSRGSFGQDAGVRSVVIDYRVPTEVGGVRVDPGALLVGDADGVMVVPLDIEQEIVEAALAKAEAESEVRTVIRNGSSSNRAWATFGVL